MSKYEDQARREIDQQLGFRQWLADRVVVIHRTVSAVDMLRRYGVTLRYDGNRPEQMFCPFHGNSRTMAAKYHPTTPGKPDHIWCFVCQEQWDAITLWKKFEDFNGKFSALLRHIEVAYGITPPEGPSAGAEEKDETERLEVEKLFEVCERRLKMTKRAFDMRGYVAVGAILDKLVHRLEKGSISYVDTKTVLMQVLDKIGAKERSCPDG